MVAVVFTAFNMNVFEKDSATMVDIDSVVKKMLKTMMLLITIDIDINKLTVTLARGFC